MLTVSGVSGFCWAFPNLYSMKTGLVPTWEHFQLNGGNYCTYHREIVSKFFFPTGNFYFTLEINSHSSGKLFPYLQWDVSNSLQINFFQSHWETFHLPLVSNSQHSKGKHFHFSWAMFSNFPIPTGQYYHCIFRNISYFT